MSTISPLSFYSDLVFHNGIQNVLSEFAGNKNLLSDGFTFFQEYDYYMKDEMVIDDDIAPVFEMTIINREDFFKSKLNDNKKCLYHYLKQNELSDNFSNLLADLYDNLHTYIKKAVLIESKYTDIISTHLIGLIKDIKIQFPRVEYHKVFRVLNNTEGYISYFKYKDLKNSFFEDLYVLTYSLNLIDDVETSEETFYDVFTSTKLNSELKITFIEKNHLVAFYLKEIEPFFNNLTPVTIETSCFFYNKQGKPLKSSDLYTSLSRNKGNNVNDIIKIENKIDALKKMYLK